MAYYCLDPVNGNDYYSGRDWTLELYGENGVLTSGSTHLSSATGGFTGKEGKTIRVNGYYLHLIDTVVSDTEVVLHTAASGPTTNVKFAIGGAVKLWTAFQSGYLPSAAGDEIRVAKTSYSAPAAAGALTWAHESRALTFASGRIKKIDGCESGWTAVAPATVSHAANYQLEGTYFLKITPSTFTTGKMAYKEIGEVDLSAFQGISFVYRGENDNLPANYVSICLCSDTTGDTVVDEIVVPADLNIYPTSPWFPMRAMRTGGGNLGASIKSIAIYARYDVPGSPLVGFDDFVAIKDLSDANHLCHGCVLSQTNEWPTDIWGITCFSDDTTITLAYPFYGTPGEVSSYRREMWPMRQFYLNAYCPAPDPRNNPLIYSGGWNPATGTQDGLTCYYGWTGAYGDSALMILGTTSGLKVTDFLLGGQGGPTPLVCASYSDITLEDVVIVGLLRGQYNYVSPVTFTPATSYDGGCSGWTVKHLYICGSHYGFPYNASKTLYDNYYRAGQYHWYMEDVKLYSSGNLDLGGFVHLRATDLGVYYYGYAGSRGLTWDKYCHDLEIQGCELRDCGPYAITAGYGGSDIRIIDLVTSGSATAAIQNYNSDLKLFNPSIAEATKYTAMGRFGRIARIKDGGVAGTHIVDTWFGKIESEASVRHTASGIAWKLSPTNTLSLPLQLRLAVLAVKAGIEIQVGVWLRRTNTGLSGRMFIPGGHVGGIASEQAVWVADSADVYRQYTLAVTPTEDGVIEVWVEARGGTTYSMYVDDFSVV